MLKLAPISCGKGLRLFLVNKTTSLLVLRMTALSMGSLKNQAVQMVQSVSEEALGLDLPWVQLSVHSVQNQRSGQSQVTVNNGNQ